MRRLLPRGFCPSSNRWAVADGACDSVGGAVGRSGMDRPMPQAARSKTPALGYGLDAFPERERDLLTVAALAGRWLSRTDW